MKKPLWLVAMFLLHGGSFAMGEGTAAARFRKAFVEPEKMPDLSVLPAYYLNRDSAIRDDRAAVLRGDSAESIEKSRRLVLRYAFFPIRITDQETGIVYELANDRRTVTARKPDGSLIWKTDPFADAKLRDFIAEHEQPGRITHPYIYAFDVLPTGAANVKKPVLAVSFSTKECGFLEMETGKYTSQGND